MKLVNSKYNLDIEFEENISNTLVLENKQHMIDVIQNLILQLKGDEGDFVLSAEKNVKFVKVVEFIANPFEIDFNNKKIVTKLFEQLIAVASECVEEYNFINGKIVGTLDDICSKIEYSNVEYNLEYEWKSIFKLYNVRIGENYNSLCEKIEEYVKVLADILHIKLLILLNIKEYLTKEEIDNLQKICFYKKIFLLLIESEERFVLDNGKTFIIDKTGV